MSDATPLVLRLSRVRSVGAAAGLGGAVGCVLVYQLGSREFFPGYLVAWLFWLAISLGSLVFLMIHNLTGGAWGLATRPVFESAVDPLLLLALLFIPIWLGQRELYPWTDPGVVAASERLTEKAGYLNPEGYTVRSVINLALWVVLGLLITGLQPSGDALANVRRQEQAETHPSSSAQHIERVGSELEIGSSRRRIVSGPGLILYGFSITIASIDWVMSLEPEWYSTMYGTIFMAGHAAAGLALAIIVTALVTRSAGSKYLVSPARFHDLGNLLLIAVIFWAYVVFMQFLIIWSGDLPEEVAYYIVRSREGWPWVAVVLACLFFALPFGALLSRNLKRDRKKLAVVAAIVVSASLVDWYWLVVPPFGPLDTSALQTLVALVAIGGFWMMVFAARLGARLRTLGLVEV